MSDHAERSVEEHDVIVVGAGIAGLIAARSLHRAGVDVIVLEAADRVGGRAQSETTSLGSRVDVGGQWIGHDHHRLVALADELSLTRYPMPSSKLPHVIDEGRSRPLLRLAHVPAGIAVGCFAALARFGSPMAAGQTLLGEAIAHVPGARSRRLLEVIAGVSWTCDLNRFTLAAAGALARAQHGVSTILGSVGGAQDSLVVEGMGTIADTIAAGLGDRVRLQHRVLGISRDSQHVLVRTEGRRYRARHVIVAVPAPVAAKIEHEPPLPRSRRALEDGTHMGSVYKAIAVYERPFWRSNGWRDRVVLDRPGSAVFDTSPPGGPGHLCMLIPGPEGRAMSGLDETDRRKLLLEPLVSTMGPGVREPVGWHEKFWHLDPIIGGGYIALPTPGSTAGIPPLRHDAVGRLHWAGAEHALDHPGYLDGAIESGQRAAQEILDVSGRDA